jgi:LuxR family maltose regulon positive regulatory protein
MGRTLDVETATAVGAGRRRIIKRPRLTRMLDESGARIVLLVAPAGYGKTTLALEWLGEDVRRAAWYRGGPASADVAALAVGLAQATSEIVPGAGDRMRERLRATDRPEEEARLLAEMLAEDLGEWPKDAWLAFDDYQFAMDSAAAEEFVDTLATDSPLRLLITSRRRPTWASARRRLYGEVVEFDRTLLAMSDTEALAVLNRRAKQASELLEKAAGWPAVIGLAALTGELSMPNRELPETLYDFFAEELYQHAEPGLRWGLCQLAAAPSIDRELAEFLFGLETASLILDHALRLGVLYAHPEGEWAVHPLLLRFLDRKFRDHGDQAIAQTVETVGTFLIRSREWDDVFALIQRFGSESLLVRLVEVANEDLLSQGRVATLNRWLEYAHDRYISSPILDLTEAEIAFRQTLHSKAESLGLDVAKHLGPSHHLVSRAYALAGRSAHLEGREDSARNHYEAARCTARDDRQLEEALWGKLLSSFELERFGAASDAVDILEELASLPITTPEHSLRVATGQIFLALRIGTGLDDNLGSAIHLVPRVEDPMIGASFLHVWAAALAFSARYSESLQVISDQINDVEKYRLSFALPHSYLRKAEASRGLRRFADAHGYCEKALTLASPGDEYVPLAAAISRALTYLAQQRFSDALESLRPDVAPRGRPGGVGEFYACRGLVLACTGQVLEARKMFAKADAATSLIEARALAQLGRAVAALEARDVEASSVVEAAFDLIKSSGYFDIFVSVYRAYPPLLSAVASEPDNAALLERIVTSARDTRLGRDAGLPLTADERRHHPFTSREREVFELLTEGLTNREIAARLFVSEVTVKVHIRHIFAKLNVRSRTEAVLRAPALLDRQATSATDRSSND